MGEIKKLVTNLAEVIKKYLADLCDKENLQLVECKIREGKLYFKIRYEKDTKLQKVAIVIEHDINISDVEISRIKKRVRQIIHKEPQDARECIQSDTHPVTKITKVCPYFTKFHIWEGKKILNFCGKFNETCTQLKYKGKP